MAINLSHCFHPYDLYETFNATGLKIKRTVVQEKYGCNKKRKLCASVLIYFFYLIICDILENNVTFELPLFNNRLAFISVKPIMGEDFKLARQRGAFGDVDILMSNFTGYQFNYSWQTKSGRYRYKPVYLSKKFKDVFVKYINEGKQYY